MTLKKICMAAFVLVSGTAVAQDSSIKFRCEGKSLTTESQIEPFSVEISNKAATVSGVNDLDSNFSLIQQDSRFYVFKNGKKTQGGNIDRSTGGINLYALDKGAHKIAISISGICVKGD